MRPAPSAASGESSGTSSSQVSITDFPCFKARMTVEVDGTTHSTNEEIARDAVRSAAPPALGYDDLLLHQRRRVWQSRGRAGDGPHETAGDEAAH